MIYPEFQGAQVAAEPPVIESVPSFYRSIAKRGIDILLVLSVAPTVLCVVIGVAAMIIALDGHNPFYCQTRLGRHGRKFRIWKLRSMIPNGDALLESYFAENHDARREWETRQKLKQDPRITRIGRLIRKTSIDELPQFWNVLNGTMSIVGPRPMLVDQDRLYPGRSYYRMRPGITGLWQVSARNETEFSARAHFDDAYDRAMSFQTDLGIMLKTVAVVFRCTGH